MGRRGTRVSLCSRWHGLILRPPHPTEKTNQLLHTTLLHLGPLCPLILNSPASMQWSARDVAETPGASALEGSLEDEPHIGPLDGPDR